LTAFTLLGAAPVGVIATPLTPVSITQDEPPSFDEARSLMNDGDFAAAADAFGQIVEAQPEFGAAAFYHGYTLHMSGQVEKAIPAHKNAARFEQFKGIALYNLGCAHALQGRADEAFKALADSQKAGFDAVGSMADDSDLESLRNDPRFAAMLGIAAGDSMVEVNEWSDHDGDDHDEHGHGGSSNDTIDRLLGMVREGMMAAEAKWPGILARVEEVVGQLMMRVQELMSQRQQMMGGDDEGDWNGVSESHVHSDDGELMEQADGMVSASSNGMGAARRLMGNEEYAAAAAMLMRVVEAEPDNGDAWFNLGYCLHADGQIEKAIEVHKKAATFDDFRGIALYNLGCAYALKGKTEKAFETLILARQAGFDVLDYIDDDADLKSVREHPGYGGLREALRNGGGL
jgi:Flp pilus assembly protein TadD